MNNRKIMGIVKRAMTGILTAAMVITGVVVSPVQAEAEKGDDIKWVEYSSKEKVAEFKQLYADKKAPECADAGFVFAGWYTEKETAAYNVSKAEKAINKGTDVSSMDKAYAKFVPAYVLSVKGQNRFDSTNGAQMRIVSSVDSLHYEKVGVQLMLKNSVAVNPDATSKVHSKIYADDTAHKPTTVFGEESAYFITHDLTNIPEAMYKDIMYVRPYWITYDGTTVYGLAKHLHYEDGVNKYINIPINLYTTAGIAAGIVSVTYPEGLTYVDAIVSNGSSSARLFEEFAVNPNSETRVVKMVGNVKTITSNVAADKDVYATLRFKMESGTPDLTDDEFMTFGVTADDFCDISEEKVEVDKYAWDITY